jgi:DNA-binding XRE family transcriptional regulator
MLNPILYARKELGLTRNELARASNLAPTTLQYIEWGAYGTLPQSLIYMLNIIDLDIETHYDQWKMQRRINSNLPLELPEDFPVLKDIMHPHREWRELICRMALNPYCSEICIPRAVIQEFERGKQKKFPKQLKMALILAVGSKVTTKLVSSCGKDF